MFAATEETPAGPWTLVPARVLGRYAVTFRATHFSLWTILGFDLGSLWDAFKAGVIDPLDGGATSMTVSRPTCSGQATYISDGFHELVTADANTVYWCAGTSGNTPIMRVVNTRDYPLELAHPGLTVLDQPAVDYGQLASLSHATSGADSILGPGGQITYAVDINIGNAGGFSTEMDGFGQSLYQLQTGVNTALQILTRFGYGAKESAVNIANTLLGDTACIDAVRQGPVAMFAACFSPAQIKKAFGTARSIILIPIMTAGPLVAYFESEGHALVDQFTAHDRYSVKITRPTGAVCTARALFEAAVAKEHFNPDDPSYAGFGAYGNDPGAYDVQCDAGWATAAISRPNVGTTDGGTVFHSSGGHWIEVGQTGGSPPVECVLSRFDMPATVSATLSHGVKGSGEAGCDVPGAYGFAQQQWQQGACGMTSSFASDMTQVKDDLVQAGPDYAGDPHGYDNAIAELNVVVATPLVDPTPTQQAAEHAALGSLDTFFHTPGLYTDGADCQSP